VLVDRAGGGEIRIETYGGRGPLGAWLRVAAVRVARALARDRRGALPIDEPGAVADPIADPELSFLKERYRREFRDAFHETLRSLADRERTVLRFYVVEGMSARAIAAIYHVHESTVGRWMDRTREQLLAGTMQRLGDRLQLPASELSSIIDLVRSRFDVSVLTLLREKR